MRAICIVILVSFSQSLTATSVQPFLTQNQNPLLLIYGLPPASPADIPDEGQWFSDWTLNLSNSLNIENLADEDITIDGETYQLNLHAEYGLSDRWALGAKLSWLEHSAGFLDRHIEKYHDWLNLPQGKRFSIAHDRLLYRYERNGTEELLFQKTAGGPGDFLLTAAYHFSETTLHDYSLRTAVKIPLGDVTRLTGSGAADLSIWLAGRKTLNNTWQLYGTGGLLWLGKSDVLNGLQRNQVVFGNLGLQWQSWEKLAIKMQAEWNTAFYRDTRARILGDALQLSFGFSWQLTSETQFDFAITEDVKTEASPDVTFHFALRFRH